MLSQKLWIGVLSAIVISFASIGMSTYSLTRAIQTEPIMASTPKSSGQKFNWTVAEVIEVQGNVYAYLGFEAAAGVSTLHIARWQNGWLSSMYSLTKHWLPYNVTLCPYKLQLYDWNFNYLTAQFFETQ